MTPTCSFARAAAVACSSDCKSLILATRAAAACVTAATLSFAFRRNDSTAIEFPVEGEPRPLRTIMYDEIYSIGRKAIADALQHANPTRIEVEITYGPIKLRLRCRDNGRGMSKERLEAGSPAGHWRITRIK